MIRKEKKSLELHSEFKKNDIAELTVGWTKASDT